MLGDAREKESGLELTNARAADRGNRYLHQTAAALAAGCYTRALTGTRSFFK